MVSPNPTPRRPSPRLLPALVALFAVSWTTAYPPFLTAQEPRETPSTATVGITNEDLFGKSLQVAYFTLDQYGAYDNPEEMQRMADIAYRVAREANYPKVPFTFHLVDMPEPNAFALPGGHIFITRGMLDLGLTDDMLAALLGHEIAHVVEEHYLEMRKKATILGILSNVLMAGVLIAAKNDTERNEPYNPYDPTQRDRSSTGDLIQGAAATSLVVSELLLRSYSRTNETEADLQGQRWAAAAGFDPLGAAQLMHLMGSRIPQNKRYGYWMTHPFFDERVRAAESNGELIKRQQAEDATPYRQATQDTLMQWLDEGSLGTSEEARERREDVTPLVETQALTAWPQGEVAEGLRLKKLHRLRDAELDKATLARDFGLLIREYKEERFVVESLTPETDFLATLDREINAFERQREDLYPLAVKVLEGEVYETAFLETFLSNFPDTEHVPEVALELGAAKSRLRDEAEAVRLYLLAWESDPESDAGQRAARGLRTLAPRLDGLAALQQLALQKRDEQLAAIARDRLEQLAGSFKQIDNGAEYLRRFPEGPHVETVLERVNLLAENLLGEVLLYQAVGDTVKAIERMNKILTYAPTSEAAEQLRDKAVFTPRGA